MALTFTPLTDPHFECPDFELLGTDEKLHSKSEFATGNPFLVMFICNHCPYVKAVEDRLVDLANKLSQIDVRTVAINSNDGTEYPEDSFPSMQKRAAERKYPFPYLHDQTQSVAKAFDAVCTPDFFLFKSDQKLFYRGRLDDSWKDSNLVTTQDLWKAALLLSQNQNLNFAPKPSMGCNIKWK